MLSLFYTGAIKFNNTQLDRNKSLGGYISSTLIPNAFVGNLFGEISRLTIMQDKTELRVFAIKNIDTVVKTGLKAYFNYPVDGNNVNTNYCDFQIGFAVPSSDACGDLYSEKVPNMYSLPYGVTLVDAVGFSAALTLPNLDPGMYLCIYIKRKLNALSKTQLTNDQLAAISDGTLVLETLEDIGLTFAWT